MQNHPDRQPWIMIAQKYVGQAEVKGWQHNPQILEWWRNIDMAWIHDDETAWCAAFVGGVLHEAGLPFEKSAAARSYQDYGVTLPGPAVGCVVTFWRGNPEAATGHVGFVVGRDEEMNLMVLGGNQGDRVCIKPFDTGRVLSYTWPEGQELPDENTIEELPVVAAAYAAHVLSTDEA